MSARISALESTQNDFKLQLSEVLQTTSSAQQSLQQNTLVLSTLSSMFSIMMEKIGNPGPVCDPKSPIVQNTNSHMPSSEPMLNSWAGSAGETPRENGSKVTRAEDATDVAKLNGKGVMGDGKSPEGDSNAGASKVGGTEAKESAGGVVMEGGSLGGGDNETEAVGEPTPEEAGNGKGGVDLLAKGGGSGSKLEGSGDGGSGRVVSVEGGSGGSGHGDGTIHPSGNVDRAQALSVGKIVTPTKRRRKNKPNSPTIVGGRANQDAQPCDQVSSDIAGIGTLSPIKLLIFNVHGTLLDCSRLSEPNPNTSIRITTRSKTMRIVFRPWLTEFIDRCFKNFRVAFWGIKSTPNMEDVVAEMMRKFDGSDSHKPMFCWSAKDLEEGSENIGVSKWKKPLSKVWGIWPEWNEGNTMIIDHLEAMVDCNPVANIIIPPPFYVEGMTKLADDNNYLRKDLWPLLKGLVGNIDVHKFRSVLPKTKQAVGEEVQNVHAVGRTTRSSKMKLSNTSMSGHPKLSGEGTCELLVHIVQYPLTYVNTKLTNGH